MNIDSTYIFSNFSINLKNFIKNIINESNRHSIDMYLVGGFIRDYLLGVDSKDIDIVFVGDSSKILHFIDLNFTKYEYSRDFKTIKINIDQYEVDLISARSEIYKHPGSLPEIKLSNIIDDLNRRDFTINSMALKLNNIGKTPVMDLGMSIKDLEDKLIRVHHSFSFVDDPTRIFRALRYAARYKFKIEEETEKLIGYEIDNRKLSSISHIRILNEITKDFKELNYGPILELYKKYAIYDIIFSDSFSAEFLLGIHNKYYNGKHGAKTYSGIDLYKTSMNLFSEENLINFLLLVCIYLSDEEKYEVFSKNIARKVKRTALRVAYVLKSLYLLDHYMVYKRMEDLSLDERHLLLYFVDDIIFSELIKIHSHGVKTRPHISADYIKEKGISKRHIGQLLEQTHKYKFEKHISLLNMETDDLLKNRPLYKLLDDDSKYLDKVLDMKKEYYLK